jgi:hypothetical protein
VLNRMAEHNRVATVSSSHAYGCFVCVFVVLNVSERHPLRLEGATELDIQQLDGDIIAGPHLGELVEELVPIFPGRSWIRSLRRPFSRSATSPYSRLVQVRTSDYRPRSPANYGVSST